MVFATTTELSELPGGVADYGGASLGAPPRAAYSPESREQPESPLIRLTIDSTYLFIRISYRCCSPTGQPPR